MSNMKLIMEGWNNYSKAQQLAEDTDYVHNFLGVSPLLLESSRNEYYRQILAEQELYEGILDSIKDYIKSKTGPTKNLAKVILLSLKDKTNAETFIKLVREKVFDPTREKISQIAKKLKLDKLYALIEKFILLPLRNVQGLVKQVFAVTTAAVVLSQIWDKIKPYVSVEAFGEKQLDDVLSKIEDEIMNLLKGGGKDVVAKAAQSQGFQEWLKSTAGAVGGAAVMVADTLEPATTAFFAKPSSKGPKGQAKMTAAKKKKAQQRAAKMARKRNR